MDQGASADADLLRETGAGLFTKEFISTAACSFEGLDTTGTAKTKKEAKHNATATASMLQEVLRAAIGDNKLSPENQL